jgi:16S rRNA processing protein RimM
LQQNNRKKLFRKIQEILEIMENIDVNECYQVGYITKTHALKGEVSIFLDVDYPEEYEEMESFFVEIEGELITYEVENVRMMASKPQTVLVKIKGIDKIEDPDWK